MQLLLHYDICAFAFIEFCKFRFSCLDQSKDNATNGALPVLKETGVYIL